MQLLYITITSSLYNINNAKFIVYHLTPITCNILLQMATPFPFFWVGLSSTLWTETGAGTNQFLVFLSRIYPNITKIYCLVDGGIREAICLLDIWKNMYFN